jgi:hypothetical protein
VILVVSDPRSPGTRRRTRSVLVIDDDPDIQLVLEFALEDAGYRPLPAPTGEAGLLIAHEADPDAALVDLRLPGLRGLDRVGLPLPRRPHRGELHGRPGPGPARGCLCTPPPGQGRPRHLPPRGHPG